MKIINNFLYMLKIIYYGDKKRILFIVFLSLISALKNIINVVFIKLILDCIVKYNSFYYLVIFVLVERIISTTISYFECLLQWQKCPISDSAIKKYILNKIYSKSINIGLSELDKPEFYDKYNRAISESEQRPFLMISTIESFLSAILTIFSISTIIIVLNWKLIFLSLISSLISVLINIITSKFNFNKNNTITRLMRKMDYIRRLFYLPQYIEEMKTNNYNNFLFVKLDNETEEYKNVLKKFQSKITSFNIVQEWQTFVINFGLASIFIGKKIINGTMEVNSFTSLIYASTTLSGSLANIFSVFPQMIEHSLFIDNLREVLEYRSPMEETKGSKDIVKGESHSISLDNVSFRYHSSANNIIKNISLNINKGEKIALVGKNGAGKSTLVKLILRLYDPQEGNLYFDNENYRNLNVGSLRNEIAVVYQNFQTFAFSIGENVLTREIKDNKDESDVWEALKKSGLSSKIENLPDKLNTPLTNEFEENGINLSGGENQKLAIAKAIYKDAGVFIMDEPSSSLDPISEHEMYERMFDICKDKTLILISHKLYSTKMVDKIYYMENGEILECGNHQELMELNGRYAELYNTQAKQYR